jgi:hypothetical protein
MDDPKALKLFQEILRKTRAGRLRWEATASDSQYFTVLPGGFTVAVDDTTERGEWGGIEHSFTLVLRGIDGDLLTVTPAVDGVTNEDLGILFEFAKRQALGVDATVDKLLGELAKM